MLKQRIVIATVKKCNVENAKKFIDDNINDFDVLLITDKDELTENTLCEFNPEYVFFPHWSWIIPNNIYNNYNCIVFHTGDLPEFRGGSPIQNHIVRKVYNTKLSAIQVCEKVDSGKIYLKRDLSLEEGSLSDILAKISDVIFMEMMPEIITRKIVPRSQRGEGSYFPRRTPDMSNINNAEINDIRDLYDFIRMLDGEGYPKAYLLVGDTLVMELYDVKEKAGELKGSFKVYEK